MPGLHRSNVLRFLGLCAIFASCRCPAQSPGKPNATDMVEGTVVTKGLPDVTVRLERVPTDPLSTFDGYLATVESDGRFHFEDVAPGDYRLTGSSSSRMHGEFGSLRPGVPGAILELKAGEDRKGLSLELFPDPVGFCGRVLDADGRPLRADVEIYGPEFVGDAGQLLRPLSEQPIALTDPNGYFLLSGWLIPDVNSRHRKFFLRSNGVWYPSTEYFGDAVAITAAAISDAGCKTIIQMPRTRCTGHRVIASLADTPAAPPTAFAVSLYEWNPANVLFEKDAQPSIYNSSRIEFDNVCDGSYVIVASNHDTWTWRNNNPKDYASKLFQVDSKDTDVTVASADQHEIWKLTHTEDIWRANAPKLPPLAPASIQGTLALVDGLTWERACPSGFSQEVSLQRDDSLYPINTTLDKDGHFSFDKLEPGAYTLNPGSYEHGAAYLKRILLNGRALPTLHFTLAPGEAAQMNVEVSNDRSGVAGKPRAGDTEPHYLAPGTHPAASVAGRVNGPDAAGANLKLTAVRAGSSQPEAYEAQADNNGRFRLDGVAPGIYKLSTEGEHHQYSEYGAKGPGMSGLAVVLNARQQRQGLEVKAFAKTPLCGTVFGPDGLPRAGMDVWIRGYTNIPNPDGSPGNWTKHTRTDANGKYMISEAGPGDRELWVQEGDRLTYFPSDARTDQYHDEADLKPEQQGCVFDIYLRGADGGSAKAHTVSGIVEGKFDASLADRFYVDLEPADREFTPRVERVQMKEAGSFTLTGVWPGKYMLTVEGEYGNGTIPCGMPSSICMGYFHHPFATEEITVADRDVKGIRLSIGSLPTLEGEFVVDGKLPQGLSSLKLTFFWGNDSKMAEASADGHFSFPPLDAFRYGFSITNYPPEDAYQWVDYGPVYVVSATLDGKSVTGRHFELHIGQKAHLTIHVKVDAARGKLTVAGGEEPVDPYRDFCKSSGFGGSSMALLMIPDPLPEDNSGIIGVAAQPQNNGEEWVQSAPPGRYRVVAVDNVGIPTRHGLVGTSAAWWHDFLVKLAALGNPAEVVAGQEFNFTVPLLTERAQRLMAEMGMTATR